MLTRAILTGGVLSILAGSIVYFGTEGADALETDMRENLREEATELAGGTDTIKAVEVHPHDNEAEIKVNEPKDKEPKEKAEEPKKKWLDQYLKQSKEDSSSDENLKELEVVIDQPSDVMFDQNPKVVVTDEQEPIVAIAQDSASETDQVKVDTDSVTELRPASKPELSPELDVEVELDVQHDPALEKKEKVRVITRTVRENADAESEGAYIVSEQSRVETINIDDLDIEALNLDGEIDVEMLKAQLGIEDKRNIEVRVIKREMTENPSLINLDKKSKLTIDYDFILTEAKKLMVTDMRNQAVLEIVDYAIDNGDIVQAADLVDELSTPELRDTARARIGTGLARVGNPDAAFAVLEALEIDELAAPIRLEIITALMATKAERQLQ